MVGLQRRQSVLGERHRGRGLLKYKVAASLEVMQPYPLTNIDLEDPFKMYACCTEAREFEYICH